MPQGKPRECKHGWLLPKTKKQFAGRYCYRRKRSARCPGKAWALREIPRVNTNTDHIFGMQQKYVSVCKRKKKVKYTKRVLRDVNDPAKSRYKYYYAKKNKAKPKKAAKKAAKKRLTAADFAPLPLHRSQSAFAPKSLTKPKLKRARSGHLYY